MTTHLRFVLTASILCALGFLLLWSAPFSSTAPAGPLDPPMFSLPLVIDLHGWYSTGLEFGIHPAATKGIDLAIGEEEYPPLPPGGGMGLFSTIGGNAILDLRPYTSPSQIDTYLVRVALDGSDTVLYPITFSWPNLSSYYSGPVRLKCGLDGSLFDVNMKAQSSYVLDLDTAYFLNVYVIAQGPVSGNALPVISTFGYGFGGLAAIVRATGATQPPAAVQGVSATTSAWFEYGPTRAYGSSTTPQSVTDGTTETILEPFSAGSLPPDTRMHFRAVAQNAGGTFYGADRIVSNGAPPAEPPEDSSGFVMYRTASYMDWADAKDQKDKRKSVKPKPDKVDFSFTLPVPGVPAPGPSLYLKFGGAVAPITIWDDTLKTTVLYTSAGAEKHVGPVTGMDSGSTILVEGRGLQGKPMKFSYSWDYPSNKIKGKVVSNITNTLRLPMPNLHNVGEGVFGGVAETPVEITVGTTDDVKGAHTVYHRKYKDALKTLVKGKKGGDIHHTAAPHWLDAFDKNGKPILKAQKGLAPDKHNNSLLGEQLALKLNVAASDSGFFPGGLGELVYSNSTAFDGMTVWEIALHVDTFLSRGPVPPETITDSSVYLKVVHDINIAFAGGMDTVSWGGGRVVCTGVRMLSEVPYLHAILGAAPGILRVGSPVIHPADGPSAFRLAQNYPNPFNPTTTIEFELASEAMVSVMVYNMLGQEVALLADRETFDEGTNDLEFDASALPSGVYFYRIVAQEAEGGARALFTTVRKMLLVK